jgi:transposase
MSDGTGLAELLLGLDGFRVLTVEETPDELVVEIETMAVVVGCSECGTRAEAHERMSVEIRDLACFGRPCRLVWHKRRWRCVETDCTIKTWTETSVHASSRVLLTRRAGLEVSPPGR